MYVCIYGASSLVGISCFYDNGTHKIFLKFVRDLCNNLVKHK